jgi:outer membrane protein OmpA-like peptidoglycan-associated protein/flagellar hook assembly protein FlgD
MTTDVNRFAKGWFFRQSLAVCMILLGLGLFAQENSFIPGGEDYYLFQAPYLLGTGATVTGGQSIQGDILNPAFSGDVQRTTLDINFAGILDNGSHDGFGLNFGATLPQRYGVWTGSLNFLSSTANAYNYGTKFGAHLSFAKSLYPGVSVGAGLNGGVAFLPSGTLDGDISLSLGILHRMEALGMMENFTWGFAIRDMGKTILQESGATPYPQMFTIALGSQFDLIYTDSFVVVLRGDLATPYFQDLVMTGGLEFQIPELLSFALSVEGSVQEYLNNNGRSLIPAASLTFNFLSDFGDGSEFLQEQGWSRSTLRPGASFAMLRENTMAYGVGLNASLGVIDVNPPLVTLGYNQEQFISPNNDGKNDTLKFKLSIEDERYVAGYELKIFDSDDNPIRSIKNKEIRPDTEDWQGVFDRLLAVDEGIEVPEFLTWDGKRDDGTLVEDGVYQFRFSSVDDNGNSITMGPYQLTVDNSQPQVTMSSQRPNDLIFSPNGDGNKDSISFNIDGSPEDLWQVEVINSLGTVVKTIRFEDQSPENYTWDGTDNLNGLLPDGVYSVRVSSTDKAQNYRSAQIDNIIINTEITPVTLTLEDGYFSPNGDGVKDTLVFTPNVPVRGGVKSWALRVLNEQGRTSWEITGNQSNLPNAPVEFNGKNFDQKLLPEGRYRAQMELTYVNGNKPVSTSPEFILDVTKPSVNLVMEGLPAFSPDGDGQRDNIPFLQSGSEEVNWVGEVISAEDNSVVKTLNFPRVPDEKFTWAGLGDNGELQTDGQYFYRLRAEDRAGNKNFAQSQVFTLDTKDRNAILTVQDVAFSPNGDRAKDRITFVPRTNNEIGITDFRVEIQNASNETIRTFTGRSRLQSEVIWDGLDDNGRAVGEGQYKGLLTINYANGATVEASSNAFQVDLSFPEAELSSNYLLFSPNGDGQKDDITFNQSTSLEESWTGEVFNSRNEKVRQFSWKGQAVDFRWDGTDEARNPVADGLYSYRLTSVDPAGNRTAATLNNIRIDNRPANAFLTVAEKAFSANSGARVRSNTFGLVATLNEGMASWSLSMEHQSQGVTMEFFGRNSLPNQIEWDGLMENGPSPEGEYTAKLNIIYEKGDVLEKVSTPFFLDNSPPEVTINLGPRPFSPDNDGTDDELTFGFQVRELAGVENWSLTITDPQGNPFQRFVGEGTPARTLVWDGRSSNGELVQAAVDYPYSLRITDTLGQSQEFTGEIPVDILVIKVGDRFKIAVPSITFAPNSPRLVFDDSEAGQKNRQVLRRLSEILQRYNNYKIRIEGHAVSVFWADPERAQREEAEELQPLSLQRANRVKDELASLGVNISNYTTAGLGGTQPVVPHGDEANRWKNRRVEFYLIR